MNPHCHTCSTESLFLLTKDGYDLYRCPHCLLVFVFPQPSVEFLKKDLYSYESGYQANRVRDLSQSKENERAKRVLSFIEKEKPGGTLLDVGCAEGQYMYWARERGLKPVGVELNRRTADSAVAQGFEVYNGFLGEAPFQPNSFDAIFLGEIIEHVPDPKRLIEDCKKLLKPHGIVAITTPNLDCFWSRSTFLLYKIFKIPWSSVTPPYHLFQFNPDNLDLLMKGNGFTLIHKTFILMTRLKYELGMMHLLKRFKKSKSIFDLFYMVFSFTLYALLYVVNIVLSPFLEKDFNMIRMYRKT